MATPEEMARWGDRLVERTIKSKVEALAPILATGEIACVLHRETDGDEPTPEVLATLAALGGEGREVFAISSEGKERLATADHVTRAWVERKAPDVGRPPGRIFVVLASGATLLVNFEPGSGYSIEPGSGDANVLN